MGEICEADPVFKVVQIGCLYTPTHLIQEKIDTSE